MTTIITSFIKDKTQNEYKLQVFGKKNGKKKFKRQFRRQVRLADGLAFDQSRVSYKKGMALSQVLLKIGDPTGNRTPVSGVRG